ncbi:MAG: hypothetical protein WCA45_15455 [Thiobacillaceae bacterium]
MMHKNILVRWGWLKFMYICNVVGTGLAGLGIITVPDLVKSVFGLPTEDPVTFGIIGCVYLTVGLLSILGLRSPLKYVPILFFQLIGSAVWFVGIVLPLLVAGRLPTHAIPIAILYATYVIGALMAIPFPYVFAKQSDALMRRSDSTLTLG